MAPSVLRRPHPYSFARYLTALPRRTKQLIMFVADGVGMPLCGALALWLVAPEVRLAGLGFFWLATVALSLVVFHFQGLYRSIVHFMGIELLGHAFQSVTIICLSLTLIVGWLAGPLVGLRFGIVFLALGLIYIAGSRFVVRLFLRARYVKGDRVLIYGAGDAGANLANALMERGDFVPVGFVDDNVSLHGRVINGLEVNPPARLREIVDNLGVSRVLLALPSTPRRRRRRIIDRLEELPVHVQTLPDISDLISGRARVDDIREVDVADLLGRDTVPPMPNLLDACIRGKSVMVTGAGGSIGSELCRQISRLGPSRLVLLDVSEVALYAAHRRIAELVDRDHLELEVVPVLASVHHGSRVQDVCETFQINTIYHAAAYKHVPLVEHNLIEGIHNNVFGTLHTAEAAIAAGVESFVLVSTDKAVQPTNVMGATKRMSELVLQGLSEYGTQTIFSIVRFGNVLASSGSVVPLFRDQICNGGPVTVTHPAIYRYFMTISEAAELVIQAGSMARGGDVFVLDMGQPVRIADLAEKMVHLMGLTVRSDDYPDGDIEIKYTGLRPAEKLNEELLIGSNVCGTDHSMIMRAVEDFLPWAQLREALDQLWNACLMLDCERGRDLLLESVAEYSPSVGVVDLVWLEKNAAVCNQDGTATVTALRPKTRATVADKAY